MEKDKRISMNTVKKIDRLFHDFEQNIDWIDYENVDDVENVKIAKRLNHIYGNDVSKALLTTSKEFMTTEANNRDRQGKLILKAMAEVSKLSADGLPTHI